MSPDDTPVLLAPQAEIRYAEVPGFPGYRVGDDGSVWSRLRTGCHGRYVPWHQMPLREYDGYLRVSLRDTGRKKTFGVHRLILIAFVGPPPDGMEARHFNGRRNDNRLANLAWGTVAENMADRDAHGTTARRERHGKTRITRAQVLSIYDRYEAGQSVAEIAADLKFDPSHTGKILRGLYWPIRGRVPPLAGKDGRSRGAFLREERRRSRA